MSMDREMSPSGCIKGLGSDWDLEGSFSTSSSKGREGAVSGKVDPLSSSGDVNCEGFGGVELRL